MHLNLESHRTLGEPWAYLNGVGGGGRERVGGWARQFEHVERRLRRFRY